jgi:hypothetical protein
MHGGRDLESAEWTRFRAASLGAKKEQENEEREQLSEGRT